MIFIGLTMTIIAHWPGSTSIGENPLKIAGPILLAVGAVLFFIGIVLICRLNQRERQRWERMINKFAASRQPGDMSSFGPPGQKPGGYDDQRGDTSINAPLIPPQQPDGGRGKPYNPNPNEYPGKGGYPYPGGNDGGESSFMADDNEGVPDPFRPTKPRKPKKSATGSNDDLSGGDSVIGTTVTTTTTTTKIVKRAGGDEVPVTSETSSTTTRSKTSRNRDGGGAAGDGTGGGRSGGRGPPGSQPGSSSPGGSRLLVHVKAQPGATVHIHPSGGPAVAPKPAFSTYSHSTASGETDI